MEALNKPNTRRMVPSAYTSRIMGKIWLLTTSMQLLPVKLFEDQFLKSPREIRKKTVMINLIHQVTWIPSIRRCKTRTITTLVPVQIRLDLFAVMLEDMGWISKTTMLVRSPRVAKIRLIASEQVIISLTRSRINMMVFHRQILTIVSSLNSKGTISPIPVNNLRIRSRGMLKQEQFLLVSQQLNRPSLSQTENVVPSLKTRIHSKILCTSLIDKYLPDKEIHNQNMLHLHRPIPQLTKIAWTASTMTQLILFCRVLVKQESWEIKTIVIRPKQRREVNNLRSKKIKNKRMKNKLRRRFRILLLTSTTNTTRSFRR